MYIVHEKTVECLVCCNPSVGLDPRLHALGYNHGKKLIDYKPVPGALTVEQAEALLQPRKTEGKSKRRKRYHKERRRRRLLRRRCLPPPSPPPRGYPRRRK